MSNAEVEKLKAEVAKAQGQRDLAEQARRAGVDEIKQLGQQNDKLRKDLAAVTDARDTNAALEAQNAELVKQVRKQAAAADKAAAIVAAFSVFADAEAALKKLI